MSVRVSITDLRTHTVYRGILMNPRIQVGHDLLVSLTNIPGHNLRVPMLRGWVFSDSNSLIYLNDRYNRKWRMRIQQPKILEGN